MEIVLGATKNFVAVTVCTYGPQVEWPCARLKLLMMLMLIRNCGHVYICRENNTNGGRCGVVDG